MIEVTEQIMARVLYQQTDFPVLQNRVYCTAEEAKSCVKSDIVIVEDQQTGLVYNAAFRPELMVYDSTYNNEQALSQQFCTHLKAVAELIESALGKDKLLEVGCGKGYFLELLQKRGLDITGCDPTYEGNNPRVVKKYFEPGILDAANGLILRHVLEHVPNPIDFLSHLRDANGGKGLIYIEVPCFDWICEKRAWFDIHYEHVNYFRLSDFARMFARVITIGKCFSGQYLYVIADLATLRRPVFEPSHAVSFPREFLADLDTAAQNSTEQPACIWGAASKGVVFSLLRRRLGLPVDLVIDINPAKQGKFLPGTGLLVQSPESGLKNLPAGSPIYVMNPNYLEEIKVMSNQLYTYIGIDQ